MAKPNASSQHGIAPGGGGGRGEELGSILVCFVVNYRPYLSHRFGKFNFRDPNLVTFLFIHLPCQSFKKVIQKLSSMDDNNPVEK